MSYSFTINASSREKAKAMVAAKLDEVVAQQPVHRNDRDQALAAAESFIDVCEEPSDEEELTVGMQGSISWNGSHGSQPVIGAGVSIAVGVVFKRAGQA